MEVKQSTTLAVPEIHQNHHPDVSFGQHTGVRDLRGRMGAAFQSFEQSTRPPAVLLAGRPSPLMAIFVRFLLPTYTRINIATTGRRCVSLSEDRVPKLACQPPRRR